MSTNTTSFSRHYTLSPYPLNSAILDLYLAHHATNVGLAGFCSPLHNFQPWSLEYRDERGGDFTHPNIIPTLIP